MPVISVLLAMESLREQCEVVIDLDVQKSREMAIRDNLIREAREANVSYRQLVKITGLSRDRLYTIANSPRVSV